MDFISDFKDRGYFYQCTDLEALAELTSKQKIAAYIGFDCTATSLHVGSLMQIMILRLLQQHGHKPIVLVGGATSKIGDPSFKDESRKLLSQEALEVNMAGIKKSLSKFIKFGDGESDAVLVNNADWLDNIKYTEFLSNYGRLFSVNRMLGLDSVKSRLDREQSLTFLEFNYMLLQSYDFYHLNKNYNCALQLGGSDQWGNIVMGVEFTRKVSDAEVFGLTTPLLTTSSGVKMGKSVGGAVWLNEDMLSPYDYYQYWRNCEDLDVLRFAKLYAEYDHAELENFVILTDSNINEAKKQLAYRLTELCHGSNMAVQASDTSRAVFEEGALNENLPTFIINAERLKIGIVAYELFFEVGFTSSKSESRKLIRGGGARINDIKIDDENKSISLDNFKDKVCKLSSGKKKHVIVKFEG